MLVNMILTILILTNFLLSNK